MHNRTQSVSSIDTSSDVYLPRRKKAVTKFTFKKIFRVLILTLLLSIIIIIAVIFPKIDHIRETCDNSQILETITNQNSEIKNLINSAITNLNVLLTSTTVDLPIKLNNFGKSIVDQVTMMVRQCNAVCRGPGDRPTQNIELFKGLYHTSPPSNTSTKLSMITEASNPDDIVPRPGKLLGCTRFPSFSVHYGLWCYGHMASTGNCSGSSPSVQIIRIGSIGTNKDGTPKYVIIASASLPETTRLYHCSVTMTSIGCYILCTTPSVSETDDYSTMGIEKMSISFLSLDGYLTQLGQPTGLDNQNLYALYPGPGSGVIFRDFLIFPMMGGIRLMDAQKMLNRNITYRGFPPSETCTESELKLKQEVANMLTSPYYGEVLVLNFLYVCSLLDNIPGDCSVQLIPPDNMTLGAESRLYVLNGSLIMYKRGSSWWPYTELYQINYRVNNRAFRVRESVRINTTSTSRPGVQGCNLEKVCPKVCVSGIYQSPGIISAPVNPTRQEEGLLYFLVWTSSMSSRTGPLSSLCDHSTCRITYPIGDDTIFIGYTDSSCFMSSIKEGIYCIAFLELDNQPYSMMAIRSLSYIIN
ncbi:hemagglutinin-neuraminidase [Tuhoko virus 3]|uniref:Hemagglutinin-neuraminidase n=1 Tax=Tuhoko virus 3 TaxID=798074 RepID=D8WJ41_9MONO|nr:hemagglutinin-neuraminidase [Tuhoko virus 3]ADI80728.1 hemagglutinin-neuraminidase [Tuhoko virus 3]